MCIPPRARANVLGIVNAMASAIVVYFMAISFVVYVGDNRTPAIKFFFSAIEAANACALAPSVIALFDNFKGSLVERGNKQSLQTTS